MRAGDLAGDGLPVGRDRPGDCGRSSRWLSPTMKSRRRSAITSATPARSSCSTIGSSRSAPRCFSRRSSCRSRPWSGSTLGSTFVNAYGNWFTLVSAGFPALGTAVFGIRFQGDFGGDALRSMATANTLEQIDAGAARRRQPVPRRRPHRASGADHAGATSTNGGWSTSSATCRSASSVVLAPTPAPAAAGGLGAR